MKKLVPVFSILFFACTSEPETVSPLPDITKQQAAISKEHKQIISKPIPDRSTLSRAQRDSLIIEQVKDNRRVAELKKKSDSLALAYKLFRLDSIQRAEK